MDFWENSNAMSSRAFPGRTCAHPGCQSIIPPAIRAYSDHVALCYAIIFCNRRSFSAPVGWQAGLARGEFALFRHYSGGNRSLPVVEQRRGYRHPSAARLRVELVIVHILKMIHNSNCKGSVASDRNWR